MVQPIYVPSHLVRFFFVPSCKCTCNNATGELPTLTDTSKTSGGLSRGKKETRARPVARAENKGGQQVIIFFLNLLRPFFINFQIWIFLFSVITKISDLILEFFLMVDVHLNEVMFSNSQGKSTKLAIRGGLNPGPKPGGQREA